jgi:tetratricopeptide (TPR) repeat protein
MRVGIKKWLWLSLTVVVFTGTVNAENADVSASGQAQLDAAERAFFRGLAEYRRGVYGAAIIEFQRALSTTGNRALTYNIARCHEALGQEDTAADWYRAYLATEPADTTAVVGRLRNVDPNTAQASDTESSIKVATGPGLQPETLQPLGTRWLKWGLIGTAGASISIALALGRRAVDAEEKSRAATDSAGADAWAKEARHHASVFDVFLGVGLLSAGISTYLILSEGRRHRSSVSVAPAAGGAHIRYLIDF